MSEGLEADNHQIDNAEFLHENDKRTDQDSEKLWTPLFMQVGLCISFFNLIHKADYNFPLFVAGIYIWKNQIV